MKTYLKRLALVAMSSVALAGAAYANDVTSKEGADARTKVATAVALVNIAMADKDGDALLVAARMLAKAGPVARLGEPVSDGNPALYDLAALAASAKEMGADAAKADEVAKLAAPTAAPRGYWYYTCDSFNNCWWIWAGD